MPALVQVAGLAVASFGVGVLFGLGAGIVAAGAALFVVGVVLDIPARRRDR